MKKWLKWLLITLGVIIIGIIAYFIIKQSLREEAILTFPNTVIVQNATKHNVDKYIKAIVYNVLEYDTIYITVLNIPDQLERVGEIDILAFIQKNVFTEKTYLLYLSKKIKESKYKFVLSHEMSHLKQFESGDLKQMEFGLEKMIYKGDTIILKNVPYNERPYEKDAFNQDDRIYRQLEKVLYK